MCAACRSCGQSGMCVCVCVCVCVGVVVSRSRRVKRALSVNVVSSTALIRCATVSLISHLPHSLLPRDDTFYIAPYICYATQHESSACWRVNYSINERLLVRILAVVLVSGYIW